jgi:hypothetical protein
LQYDPLIITPADYFQLDASFQVVNAVLEPISLVIIQNKIFCVSFTVMSGEMVELFQWFLDSHKEVQEEANRFFRKLHSTRKLSLLSILVKGYSPFEMASAFILHVGIEDDFGLARA